MELRRLRWSSWSALLLCFTCLLQLHTVIAAPVDLSDTVLRNHVFLFGDYGTAKPNVGSTDRNGASLTSSTRYVQLSNGSRFVCDTTDFQHHDPPTSPGYSLNLAMQSVLHSIRAAGLPCTHVVVEQQSIVLCFDREVRRDHVPSQTRHVLGKRDPATAGSAEYTSGHDAFGPYAATVYGDGEECPYTKRPTETEVRFYCRYTELENPIPFLTLHEASQCQYVLRVMSSRFCYITQLDHAVETETVQCRMLD